MGGNHMLPKQVDEEKLFKAFGLVRDQAVRHLMYSKKDIAFGEVEDNHIIYHASFNYKTLEDSLCTCECGKKGIICEHILALLITHEIEKENLEMSYERRYEYDSLARAHNYDNEIYFFSDDSDDEESYEQLYKLYYSDEYVTKILANMSKEEIIKLVLGQIEFDKLPYIRERLKKLKSELLDSDAGEDITKIIEQFNFRVYMAVEELYIDVIGECTLGLSQKEKDQLSWVILHGEDSQVEDLVDIFINKGVYGHPVLTDAFRILYPVFSNGQKKMIKKYLDDNINVVNVSRINITTVRANLLIMKHIISEYDDEPKLDDDVETLVRYSNAIPYVKYIFDYYKLDIDELIDKVNEKLKTHKTNIRNLEPLYSEMLKYKPNSEIQKELYYINVLNDGVSSSLWKLMLYPDFDVYFKRLQNSDIGPAQLMSIYAKLDMDKELFDLLKETKHVKDLITYTPKLKKQYNEELIDLYFEIFDKKANKAKTSADFKQTCQILKGLLKCDNGKEYCKALYEDMKDKYPQKVKLHEEINKYLNK